MNTYVNNKSRTEYWIVILLGALTAIGPISMDMYPVSYTHLTLPTILLV